MKHRHVRILLCVALLGFLLSCAWLSGPDQEPGSPFVQGTVRHMSNAPAEGVRVLLLPVDGDWADAGKAVAVLHADLRRHVVTGPDGTYRLPAPEHGLYRVAADSGSGYVFPESGSTVVRGESASITQNFRVLALDGDVTSISDVQGLRHQSDLEGETVDLLVGVVTLIRRGLGLPWQSPRLQAVYLQDPNPDGRFRTSDAIKLLMPESHTIEAGQVVAVSNARVVEDVLDPPFYDSVWSSAGLSRTQLRVDATHQVRVWYRPLSGRPPVIPPPVRIGGSGGVSTPAAQSFSDLPGRSLWHEDTTIEPSARAVDFYEGLEHMRVAIMEPEVTGATGQYGGFFVAPGSDAVIHTRSGGGIRFGSYTRFDMSLEVQPLEWQRMQDVSVGSRFNEPVTGVLDYHRGRHGVISDSVHTAGIRAPDPGSSAVPAATANDFDIAALNVWNLTAAETPDERFESLAVTVVEALASPAVLLLVEVFDDRGTTNASNPDAHATLSRLRDFIDDAGGPTYEWTQIDPDPGADGGAPNGNPRVVALYDPLRTAPVYAGQGANANASTSALVERSVASSGADVLLRDLPARILGNHDEVFENSRKPLVAAFTLGGQTLYLVGVHFTSKIGDSPLLGRLQPPDRSGSEEGRRHPQARAVADLVSQMLSLEPDALIVVAGDVNDFEFSQTAAIIEQAGLVNLIQSVPLEDRYTYVFNGYGQVLDQMFASTALLRDFAHSFSIVHRHTAHPYADPRRASDHEPLHLRLNAGVIGGSGEM